MTRKNPKYGFTLVEMLMVVTVIGILILLLIASIGGAQRTARNARVQSEIKALEHAFRSYVQLYGRFPRVGAAATVNDPENISGPTTNPLQRGLPVDAEMVELLRGGNPRNMNPRRVAFMDISDASLNADGAFVDAWGWPYRYMFDFNQDGNVFIFRYYRSGGENLTLRGRSIAVWSTGPTGWRTTTAYYDNDNIVGWD